MIRIVEKHNGKEVFGKYINKDNWNLFEKFVRKGFKNLYIKHIGSDEVWYIRVL